MAFSWKQESGSCGAGHGRDRRRERAGWEGDAYNGEHAGGQRRGDRGHHGVSEGQQGICHCAAEEVEAWGEVGHHGPM